MVCSKLQMAEGAFGANKKTPRAEKEKWGNKSGKVVKAWGKKSRVVYVEYTACKQHAPRCVVRLPSCITPRRLQGPLHPENHTVYSRMRAGQSEKNK